MTEQEKMKLILDDLLNSSYEKDKERSESERAKGHTLIDPITIKETYEKYKVSDELANKIAREYNITMIVEDLKMQINYNGMGEITSVTEETIQAEYPSLDEEEVKEIYTKINEIIDNENNRRRGQ